MRVKVVRTIDGTFAVYVGKACAYNGPNKAKAYKLAERAKEAL